tara:strand:- start:73 stop:750 length:678 start_codon:yes stop_codon:yes gene_type:complete
MFLIGKVYNISFYKQLDNWATVKKIYKPMKKFKNIIFTAIRSIIKLADNKKSLSFLGLFSFLESIIIPIPPDIFLIPITLTKRFHWLYLGVFTTVFSILGGVFAYLVGMFFWDLLGIKIINFYDAQYHIDYIKNLFNKYGWMVILIAGFSPIPYKVFTLASGVLGYNFIIFIICSIISRGLRFISLTFLIHKYGEKSITLIERHFFKVTILISIIFLMLALLFLY